MLPSPRRAQLPPPVHSSALRETQWRRDTKLISIQGTPSNHCHPESFSAFQRPTVSCLQALCGSPSCWSAALGRKKPRKFSNAGQRAGWKITSAPQASISTSSCDYYVRMRGETCKLRAKTFFMSSMRTVSSFLLPVVGTVAQPSPNCAADPACRLLCRTALRCRTAPCSHLCFANR